MRGFGRQIVQHDIGTKPGQKIERVFGFVQGTEQAIVSEPAIGHHKDWQVCKMSRYRAKHVDGLGHF